MNHLFVIAIAGAIGAVSRYGLVNLVGGKTFPWGTLVVNVLGSCLMGMFYVLIVERNVLPASMRPFFMTGFLGAFTTFSAFSLETWELFDRGEPIQAMVYIAGSVLLCIVALVVGVLLTRLSL